AVNRFAVSVHPGADLAQPGGELVLNRAIRPGPDVEQEISVVARRAGQVLDELLRALEALVGFVVAPRAVYRIARFQRQAADFGIAAEAGGILARQVFLEHLEIFALERRQMMIVADQGRGL